MSQRDLSKLSIGPVEDSRRRCKWARAIGVSAPGPWPGRGVVELHGTLEDLLGPVCDTARAAYWRVKSALRAGVLRRGPCVLCGSADKLQAHHMSARALDVVWLCAWCHGMERFLFLNHPYELGVHIRLMQTRRCGTSAQAWCNTGAGRFTLLAENVRYPDGNKVAGPPVWTLVQCRVRRVYLLVHPDGTVRRVSARWAAKHETSSPADAHC